MDEDVVMSSLDGDEKKAVKSLLQHLAAAGCTASYSGGILTVDGDPFPIEVRQGKKKHSWDRTPGKSRLVIGRYGSKMQFPQNKEGSFNLKLIVERIKLEVEGRRRRVAERNEQEGQLQKVRGEVADIRALHAAMPYGIIISAGSSGIELSMTHLTKAQASAIISLVQTARRGRLPPP